MRLCTKEQHKDILEARPDNVDAANYYTAIMGKSITPQNVRYWRSIFVDNSGKLATTDRALMQERKLRTPKPDDDIGVLPNLSKIYHCIMWIPDPHFPYQHKDMIAFLQAVQAAFPIDLTLCAGDEVDYHSLSFHDSDPNLDSAGAELEKARVGLSALHEVCPELLVCSSNHGSLVYRKAKHHGIPVQMLKSYRDVLFPEHGAPQWSWASQWIVQTPMGEVMFKHSSGNILSDAAHNRCNLAVGHSHSKFSVEYCASKDYLYWGCYGGCLIDNESYAFAYGELSKDKPIVGCTIILEGRPMLIPMVLNTQGRWIGRL